jgi:hypothetical protein
MFRAWKKTAEKQTVWIRISEQNDINKVKYAGAIGDRLFFYFYFFFYDKGRRSVIKGTANNKKGPPQILRRPLLFTVY